MIVSSNDPNPILTKTFINIAERYAEQEIPLNLNDADETLSHCYLAIRFLAEQLSGLITNNGALQND
jgi:hypothetical protein